MLLSTVHTYGDRTLPKKNILHNKLLKKAKISFTNPIFLSGVLGSEKKNIQICSCQAPDYITFIT